VISYHISRGLPFAYAVLSHFFTQQQKKFFPADATHLNQAEDCLYIPQPCLVQTDSLVTDCIRGLGIKAGFFPTATVLLLFFLLAFRGQVILNAAGRGTVLAVGLATAKRTSQITATVVSRMGQKQYPALPAPAQTTMQMGAGLAGLAKNTVIAPDNETSLSCSVPVRFELTLIQA
jgi:hypothetical protein